MAGPHDALGRRGEQLAEQFLRRAGYKLLARRFLAPTGAGEIDLVMQAPPEPRRSPRPGADPRRNADPRPTIVFVEVKTQVGRRFDDPENRVTHAKQRRLTAAAQAYLRLRRCEDSPCRFDVVTVVYAEEAGPPELQHLIDAFPPTGRSG